MCPRIRVVYICLSTSPNNRQLTLESSSFQIDSKHCFLFLFFYFYFFGFPFILLCGVPYVRD
ncbi:hypothetical protein L208DRAFT_848822 [Tricholoma matsutake]|nr:hypothetical protein L208DRAFT_848822 [Tricholoma matsutake 945]